MLKIYGDLGSGNCYKVKLLVQQLALQHEWVPIDIRKGESRTPEFLAMNPNGRIPLLQIADGIYLPESNAILFYLAEGTALLPAARLARARVLQWLFFEQYSHEPHIAVARYIVRYLGRPESHEAKLQARMAPGYAALDVMERHLEKRGFFVGNEYSIADIALYAYTHVAHEGGFDLGRYSSIDAWLERVRGQAGHIGMSGETVTRSTAEA
jgi:glutathione S-transferase